MYRDSFSFDDWVRYGDELRRPILIHPKLSSSKEVVIVGGGLSGLVIAYRIGVKRPDINVKILEKRPMLGGVIETWKKDDWICDLAVNASRPHPSVWRLIDDLGLEKKFESSNPIATKRWIYVNGKKKEINLFYMIKIAIKMMLNRTISRARKGGCSVSELFPERDFADAMTLGIVNDTAGNVDADFLFPNLTKFGKEPPKKWKKVNKHIQKSFPMFKPKRGTIASIEGGMETLIRTLVKQISELNNVTVEINSEYKSPEELADKKGIPIHSIIWAAPLFNQTDESKISIFAVGYRNVDVESQDIGYGTLIPDSKIPISGILNETDVHSSRRAPKDHRLFRLMVPNNRWNGNPIVIKECAKNLISNKEPVIFEYLGERYIPSYPPGYMLSLKKYKPDFTHSGWGFSGVSITHVIAEAERISDIF
tara:strand:- start:341 stop:1612 length:1272 start_codon:yes stop_codon:yes gene_type:complete